MPFLKFRVDRVLSPARLDTAEGRARAAEAAIEVIREHPSELVRDQYLMEVAGPCRVDPAQLRAMLAQPADRPKPVEGRARSGCGPSDAAPPSAIRQRGQVDGRDGPELEVLRHVLHDWESVEPWIHYEDLFESDLHAMAFRALMAHPTVPEAIDAADPGVADLLARLAAEEVDSEPFDAVVRLLTERARHEVTSIVTRVAAEPALLQEQQWLTERMQELQDPNAAARCRRPVGSLARVHGRGRGMTEATSAMSPWGVPQPRPRPAGRRRASQRRAHDGRGRPGAPDRRAHRRRDRGRARAPPRPPAS